MHSVKSTGRSLSGVLSVDIDDVPNSAHGEIDFPLREMNFGNRLKTWSLHRHLDVKSWPVAQFSVSDVVVHSRDPWKLTVNGLLNYHGKSTPIEARATGTLERGRIVADAHFTVELSKLGIAPPEFLFLKTKKVVSVSVHLIAVAG